MRTIKGEERQYLVLRIVAQQDLVVKVPSCNLDLVGVRDVVDKDGLDRVFGVNNACDIDFPLNAGDNHFRQFMLSVGNFDDLTGNT